MQRDFTSLPLRRLEVIQQRSDPSFSHPRPAFDAPDFLLAIPSEETAPRKLFHSGLAGDMRRPGHVQPCSRTGGKASRILNWIPSLLPLSLAIPILESSVNDWNVPGPRPDRLGPPHGPPSTSAQDFFPAASRPSNGMVPIGSRAVGERRIRHLGVRSLWPNQSRNPGSSGSRAGRAMGSPRRPAPHCYRSCGAHFRILRLNEEYSLWLRVLSPQTRRFSPFSGRGKMRAFFQRPWF